MTAEIPSTSHVFLTDSMNDNTTGTTINATNWSTKAK